ncbi:ABC transporter ABCE, iron-sulfur binding protein LdpA [Tanacetum coccineum]
MSSMAFSLSCHAAVFNCKVNASVNKSLDKVKDLVIRSKVPSVTTFPQISLQKGNWVKLICGASFEDVVDIRNLSLVYTLAGVDCIDSAADGAVVNAVNEGINAARSILPIRRPWVMISVNDDEDLHFRKAEFDPDDCPVDCSRPCEKICPANAISFQSALEKSIVNIDLGLHDYVISDQVIYIFNAKSDMKPGVITERCYGCGRCFPVCPYDKIKANSYVRDAKETSKLLERDDVDALEIHTNGRQTDSFKELWNGLGESVNHLRLVAVSLPYVGDSTISMMNGMYSILEHDIRCLNLWQLDGRPMSGDIGRGATRESIAFGLRLAFANEKPPGFLQLAGGTNAHTVDGLRKQDLFQTTKSGENSRSSTTSNSNALIGGIAYGGYARKIVGRILSSMESESGLAHIESHPEHLLMAVIEALSLVGGVKSFDMSSLTHFSKLQTAEDLQGDALLHYDAEMELMNLILLSIPNDIYNSVDDCTSAKDVNDMHFPIVTINTKFLNSLQPEWLKYVTQVCLAKRLTVDTFDDPFDYLQQFEKLVNVLRAKKNQAIIQGDRVNIQSRNSGNAGRHNRRAYVQEEVVEGSNAPNKT